MEQAPVDGPPSPRWFSWFPEFLQLGQRRIRTQVRILGLAVLVGLVAGLGAILFYVATRAVEQYAVGHLAGYDPQPHPAGEVVISWLPAVSPTLHPWLLLLIPTVGGLLSGVLVYSLAPGGGGPRHRRRYRRLSLHQGQIRPRVPLVKIIASALTLGTGGSGGREGPHRPDRGRLRLPAGQPLASAARRTPHSHGGGHGRRHRRHLPRAAGRGTVRRRGAVSLAGVRGRGHHARRDRQRRVLLHLRRLRRLAAAVRHPRPHLQQSVGTRAVLAPGALHGLSGHAVYADVLRLRAPLSSCADASALPARDRRLLDRAWWPWPLLPGGRTTAGAGRPVLWLSAPCSRP